MPAGTRVLGIAESYRDPPGGDATASRSTVAGVILRGDRSVDGVVFGSYTVGGTDATASILACWERLDRPDIRTLLVAGIAPAWFNIIDLPALQAEIDRPVIGVSFEASPGLSDAIQCEFDGAEREQRLDVYRRQPEREPVTLGEGDRTVYCRFVGLDACEGRAVVREHTPLGAARPEPLRVARLVARAGDRWWRRGQGDGVDPEASGGKEP